jgi:hypothetical protein
MSFENGIRIGIPVFPLFSRATDTVEGDWYKNV